MTIVADWHTKDHIILVKVTGHVTIEEIAYVIDRNIELVQASDTNAVYVIYDVADVTGLPPVGEIITQLTKMPRDNRFKFAVYVGITHYGLNLLAGIGARFSRQLFRNFKTLDEALTFLKLCDPTLEIELASIEE